jgi:hypothetical protein
MSWLGDVFKFENFNLNNNWQKLKENPERAFIGAMDEGSTKVWNKAFDWTAPLTGIHRHYEPMTDYWGGAPKDSYTKAEAAGINTGPGRSMHNVAKTIASLYAGGYAAGQAGAGANAGEGALETGGTFTPTEGSNFTIDPNATYTPTYSGTGAAPYAGDQQYMNQDVMEQARNTSTTGQPDSWNTPTQNSGLSPFQKQLMAKSLMNMGGQKQPQQPPLEIYKGQDAFAPMQQALPIQDEDPLKLAMALRNENG